ncbi:MAG: hypothetical protein ACYDHE_11205 [Candidatus Acidiferrales bacterium]
MSLKQVRDSKDPQPKRENSSRQGSNGNVPVTGEGHNAKKAQRVTASGRFTLRTGGEMQPTRVAGDGNVPVPESQGEKHNQSKAERVPASRRY